jgi:hypothetical protein
MAAALGSEPERIVVKDPLEERTQEVSDHLLSNAVTDSGDAQGPRFTAALVDVDSPKGLGLVCPILQATHEGQQVLIELMLEHSDADLINAGGSPVPANVSESDPHQLRRDPTCQRMSFDFLGQRRALSC